MKGKKQKFKLFLTPFDSQKGTERLFQTALESGVQLENILYLTPSPRKLRSAQVLFTRLVGRKAFIPPLFCTPNLFARELHERYGATRLLPRELKPLVIQCLTEENITIAEARIIADFITEVKRYIPPEQQPLLGNQLRELLDGFEIPQKRALFANELFQRYNRELKARGWVDDEEIMLSAERYLGSDFSQAYLLLLDSFVAPNRLEERLLSALIAKSVATFALGYAPPEGVSTREEYQLAFRFQEFLKSQAQFEVESLPANPVAPQPVKLLGFNTMEDEVVAICREIRARQKDLSLADTYVVFPRLQPYAPLVNRIFPQYGVPFTIYPSAPLSSSPPIIAVLELLRSLETDYERTATAAALTSPYFPGLLRLPEDKSHHPRALAAQCLNTVSRRAGIIKGKENWLHLADRLIEDESGSNKQWTNEFLQDLQRRVRQAIGLTEKILTPAENLSSQARRLKQFLATVEFGQNLNPEAPYYEELRSDQKRVYDLLDAIIDFAEEFELGKKNLTPLNKSLSFLINLTTKAPEFDQGGVTVVEMEETLGLNPGSLFFGGLGEDDLPGAKPADPILPDWVRKRLGMPDIDWWRDWQKFHLYRTINSSLSPAWLSFPRTRNGRPVLPTPLLDLEVENPKSEPDAVIYSEVEEQLFWGKVQRLEGSFGREVVEFGDDVEVRERLNELFGSNRRLRVTALENYLRCPFRFYFYEVLGLVPAAEPVFEVDARLWGVVVHRVLAGVYEGGAVPLEEIPARARRVLSEVAEELHLAPFWREVAERVFENLLVKFVQTEEELRGSGFVPIESEARVSGRVAPDILLEGRVDRIDRAGERVRIIDYKSGGDDVTRKSVVEGRHIQLPVYAYLLLQTEGFSKMEVENLGIYRLRDFKVGWLAEKGVSVDFLVRNAVERVREVVAAIRKGEFPPKPGDGSRCNFCELGFACGRSDESG